MKFIIMCVFGFGLIEFSKAGISNSYVTFDDIREEPDSFSSPKMSFVQTIQSSGVELSPEEKQMIRNAKMENITMITLRPTYMIGKKEFTNDDVLSFLSNRSLTRIVQLDISGNTHVDNVIPEFILENDYIGSQRDLPQISGKFGIPSSEILVRASQTSITIDPNKAQYTYMKRGFKIHYSAAQSVENGMKLVNCELY